MRIEVWLCKAPSGAQEVARYALTKDAGTNVWSETASMSTLRNSCGLTGTLYYGDRACGPNWPCSSAWTKGALPRTAARTATAAGTRAAWAPTKGGRRAPAWRCSCSAPAYR